jgi:hypothetical protein
MPQHHDVGRRLLAACIRNRLVLSPSSRSNRLVQPGYPWGVQLATGRV